MDRAALVELIAERAASDAEFAKLVDERRAGDVKKDIDIAAALSVGRKKLVPTEIGSGTVLATLQGGGGAFLDALVQVGAVNRDVYWTMDLIKQGRLRIDLPAVRNGLEGLAQAVPALAGAVTALMTLGYAPDPISYADVSLALSVEA